MSAVRWLRVSYWVGAITDAIAGVLMLFPKAGMSVYGIADFNPGADYRYAAGLGASLMLGWTVLLLWADRKPVERKGVLLITVFPVVFGLALAGAFAVTSGLIPANKMVPTWVLQSALAVLFVFSYARASSPARA